MALHQNSTFKDQLISVLYKLFYSIKNEQKYNYFYDAIKMLKPKPGKYSTKKKVTDQFHINIEEKCTK